MANSRSEAGELSPRTETRWRPEFISPSLAYAGLLGVRNRFDGARSHPGDLSRALHQVSGKSRAEEIYRRQGLGISRRWRNGRARGARFHHASLARTPRQSDLRGELQPATARW